MEDKEMLQLILEKLINVEKKVSNIEDNQKEHYEAIMEMKHDIVGIKEKLIEHDEKLDVLTKQHKEIDKVRVDVEVLKRAVIQ